MPELKPWMRVTTRNNTYVIAEVDGELVGLRIGGCESLEHLQSTATEVHAPYLHDDKVAHYCALNPNEKGALLWSKAVADMVRNDFEVRIARKQEIQAQIDKLAAELAAIP
jgi:hypothetical protein